MSMTKLSADTLLYIAHAAVACNEAFLVNARKGQAARLPHYTTPSQAVAGELVRAAQGLAESLPVGNSWEGVTPVHYSPRRFMGLTEDGQARISAPTWRYVPSTVASSVSGALRRRMANPVERSARLGQPRVHAHHVVDSLITLVPPAQIFGPIACRIDSSLLLAPQRLPHDILEAGTAMVVSQTLPQRAP